MVELVDFDALANGSAEAHAADLTLASALVGAPPPEDREAFLNFHTEQGKELQLCEIVNSYHLPGYAVPLSANKLRELSAMTPAEKALAQRKQRRALRNMQEQAESRRERYGRAVATPVVKRKRRSSSAAASSSSAVKRRTPKPVNPEKLARLEKQRQRESLPAALTDAGPKEKYTTRSGRPTRKRAARNNNNDDDDEDDDEMDEDDEAFEDKDVVEDEDDDDEGEHEEGDAVIVDEEESDEGERPVPPEDDDSEEEIAVQSESEGEDAPPPPPPRRRRPSGGPVGTPGGYATAFSDLVGNFSFNKVTRVPPTAEASTYTLDAAGKLTAAPPTGGNEDAPRVGDVLATKDAGTAPQAWFEAQLRSGNAVEFVGRRERYIGKLHGMKGALIHPTQLFEAVQELGGFEEVKDKHLWQQVRRKLNLAGTSSSGFALRRAYENYFIN